MSNDDIWNTFIQQFNDMSIKRLSYSNATSQALDEIEQDIENAE